MNASEHSEPVDFVLRRDVHLRSLNLLSDDPPLASNEATISFLFRLIPIDFQISGMGWRTEQRPGFFPVLQLFF